MKELKIKSLTIHFLRWFTLFGIIVISFYSFSEEASPEKQDNKESKGLISLDSNPESLEVMSSQFAYKSTLNVVQKRWLPRRFLSEISVMTSPVLKGVNYLNVISLDTSYRFYLSNHLSFHLKYSYFLNTINEDGKDILFRYNTNPLNLEHPQKQEYSVGVDWTPLYGKVSFLNRVIHFDIYLFLSGGFLELLRLDKKHIPKASLGGGLVFWLHKRMNARVGLSGSYYRYHLKKLNNQTIDNYFSKAHVSLGVLF